jgi:hypothetical protein
MQAPVYLQIIYWLSTPLLAILALVFLRRKLYRDFPVFFTYIVVACLSDLLRFVAYRVSFRTYINTFWITQLLNTILALVAICELFLRRLFPRFHKIRFYRYLFSVVAIDVAVFAFLTARDTIKVSVLINTLHFLDFVRVSVLAVLVGLMILMGRQWSRYDFGLALGFAIDAAAFLTTFALGLKGYLQGIVTLLPVVAFDLACLIWLIYFVRREVPARPRSMPVPEGTVRQSKEWEKVLRESLTGKKRSE